jgi:hypothetical protein
VARGTENRANGGAMNRSGQLERLRIDDEPDGAPPGGELDIGPLVGSWRNTDRGGSGGILRLVISDRQGALRVRGFGVGDPEPYDWGEVEATPFAATVQDGAAWAFNCRFEFGFLETVLSGYNKSGILVVATFNAFHDDSGRADYWTREFFHPEVQS